MDGIENFILSLEQSGLYQPSSIRFLKEHSGLVLKLMDKIGVNSDPVTMGEQDIRKFLSYCQSNYAPSTQRDYCYALKKICEHNGNRIFDTLKIRFPVDTRPNVDWLDFEDCKKILNTWMSPLQEIIVSLELLHGLRKCEVVRLTLDDLHEDYMTVTGKGHGGGKLRSVPYHPDFKRSLNRWMSYRRSLEESAYPLDQPRNLLVYLKGGVLKSYQQVKGTAISKQLDEISERSGVHFSNHTLRRTFGRELFRSGVNIEIIAMIYGHVSTQITMMYLGLNMDDMTTALNKMRLRF